jgi:outer membrane protein OmpA-like peptidoglycan-associated protein
MVTALAVTSTLCATARAQERPTYMEQRVPAPSNAFELKLGTGYTQGFGNLAPGRGIDRVAGAGIGGNAEFDYRINHPWSLGVEAQYQEFNSAQNESSRGLAFNIGPTVHFMPVMRGDPWLRLATGYRLLWENSPVGAPNANFLRHGFEALSAKVGYDIRVSPDVALGPFVGSDFNVWVWQSVNNTASHALSSAQLATFVYGGLQGRFDMGGTRTDPHAVSQMGVTAQQPPSAPPPAEETKPVSPSIGVSEDVMRQCVLTIDGIEKAPKFEYDQSDLKDADLVMLKQIADCFTTGPLKNSTLHLVGRADPRGSYKYNDALGMRRASEVSAFLEQHGVDPVKIEKTSVGKREARGYNKETFRLDRRVDILLHQ